MTYIHPSVRAAAALKLREHELRQQVDKIDKDAIPPDMTFRQWCEKLAKEGLKVDGFPFRLDDRPSMHFIYDLIPSTIQEAHGKTCVIMKCAQVGFTILEMLAAIYMARKFEPCKVGMYLPDMKLAAAKSSERFLPVVRTIPEAYARLREDTSGKKSGEGNVMIRSMGDSRFHFLWTSGRATTESFPMDVLTFDEVQEMKISDMEKTKERLGASRIKFTLMGSTANWPDRDIHWWYQKGTQHRFHTNCHGCGVAAPMDDYFPDCIGFDEDRREHRYRCGMCSAWIDNPQDGQWVAANPEAEIVSVHYTQFLSPTIEPKEIFEAYTGGDDMKNVWNRKLGKPYADPSQIPINLGHLTACVEDGIAAGVQWKDRGRSTVMGLDQMGSFNVAVIKERLPDGRQALVHLEYIYNNDPFERCSELMDEYGVEVCVVETLPNYNDAKRFAHRHNFPEGRSPKGRVFLAHYADIADEMMRWGDRPDNDKDRRIAKDERDKFSVVLDQFKCMQTSMHRIIRRECLFPDPQALTQEIVDKGVRKTVHPLKDLAFLHFMRTAIVAEKDPEQKKFRRRVVKVGIDPHTSYANMLCDVAWARQNQSGSMLMPMDAPAGPQSEVAKALAEAAPGVPKSLLDAIDSAPTGTCGRCKYFNEAAGLCGLSGHMTTRTEKECADVIPIRSN